MAVRVVPLYRSFSQSLIGELSITNNTKTFMSLFVVHQIVCLSTVESIQVRRKEATIYKTPASERSERVHEMNLHRCLSTRGLSSPFHM